jgi:hypothetical protein
MQEAASLSPARVPRVIVRRSSDALTFKVGYHEIQGHFGRLSGSQ